MWWLEKRFRVGCAGDVVDDYESILGLCEREGDARTPCEGSFVLLASSAVCAGLYEDNR